MSDNNEIIVTVHMIHGEDLKFTVEPSEAKQVGMSDDIENALHRTSLAIEVENKLLVIPYSNIEYIEVDPAPASLPLSIVHGDKIL